MKKQPRGTTKSRAAYRRALRYFPGGVNSPVRAFGKVGGQPPFIASAKGAMIRDLDGNSYIDYVGSWGPLILGHAPAPVTRAIERAARRGTSYGAPTEGETLLAREVCRRFPSIERLRFVNSGTEATMSALRLARGVTGRADIVKFEGCYHGHADQLLVKAGSGALTFGQPDSAGVFGDLARHTLVAPFNDLDAVERLFSKKGTKIAAVIVEPVAGNMGCIPPVPGFLEGLRRVCTQNKALLIFDEVMTGFRVARGGAQQRFGVRPDLTCLGKIIGGGLPVGAYGGPARLMKLISPEGPVYQAGTLSGNPLAMAAGLATLAPLGAEAYRRLERLGARLEEGLTEALRKTGVPGVVQRVGSMFCLYFAKGPVTSFNDVMACDAPLFAKFFRAMLAEGIYLAPSPYEAGFLSLAHSERHIDKTVRAARRVLAALA